MRSTLFLPSLFLLLFAQSLSAQLGPGEFSGNLQTNTQFYVRDDRIGANTVQYQRQKSSTDAWLYMNYKVSGFDVTVRFDMFNNSPLLNPQQAYTNAGIGFWSVKKSVGKLTLTGGYFYDQFGSGAAFRAFEERLIGLDYAVRGLKLEYQLSPTWTVKAFAGQQKGFMDISTNEDTRFTVTKSVVQGIYTEKNFEFKKGLKLTLGAGAVNRTLDGETINELVSQINGLPIDQRFQPKSNTYVGTASIGAQYKNFTLSSEYTFKSEEALRNPFNGTLFGSGGDVFFVSGGYSKKGLGINVQYKRVETFQLRASPFHALLNGQLTYLPSIARQNVYRLLARYIPVVQELGENAIQADVLWSPNKKTTWNANFSWVDQLDGQHLFEEYYLEMQYKVNSNFKFQLGVQSVFYSQAIYQISPSAPDVRTFTPFGECTYRFKKNPKKSIRFEAQYMHTKQDLGSFVNALVEYNFSPHWSFAVGDMVNTVPVRTFNTPQQVISKETVHYYNIFVGYRLNETRFTLNYLKQVQGVNCTGGICRVEPAFSGLRVGIITHF